MAVQRQARARHEPAVRAEALTVRRGREVALDNVSFDLRPGGITGLLGPSGSGKTTLMRTLVGVQLIASGKVTVLGRAAGNPDLRREIGYMAQTPSVYKDLTVEDNVRYFAIVHGLGRSEATEAIEAVGLGPLSTRRTAGLSGGQFSRVSLACALVSRPSLLVLDEPTVGLDPVLRAELWDRFRTMADSGTTLIISSHVMEEARHCDTLLLLREARLMATLSPEELRRRGDSEDLELAFLHLIRSRTPETAA